MSTTSTITTTPIMSTTSLPENLPERLQEQMGEAYRLASMLNYIASGEFNEVPEGEPRTIDPDQRRTLVMMASRVRGIGHELDQLLYDVNVAMLGEGDA